MRRAIFSALGGMAALTLAVSASAQSSMTLYGVVDNSIQYAHDTGGESHQIKLQSGQMSPSVWGIKGNEDLGGGLSAVVDLESQFDVNNGALANGLLWGRIAYVGLSRNELGTLTLGRQIDVMQDLVVPVQGNSFLEYFTAPGDVDLSDGSVKVNNAVKWLSPNWAGLQLAAMYGFGNVAGSVGSGQSYEVAANYAAGPLTFAAGYLHSDNGNGDHSTRGTGSATGIFFTPVNSAYSSASKFNIARTGLAYNAGPVTIGGYYSFSEYLPDGFSTFRNSEYYNNGEVFVFWQMTPETSLELGYDYLKSRGDSSATYQQVTLAADYALSKRTDLYASASYGHASGSNGMGAAQAVIADSYADPGTSQQELLIVGIRHKF
jgi:predicted porin